MAYSFDQIWDRVNHDSQKWDSPRKKSCPVYTEAEEILPMWVADMDFATPPCVIDAISQRLAHPILGYFEPLDRYLAAVNHWQKTRFDLAETLTHENVLYQNSVLGAVSSFLQAYTLPGEQVLMHAPLYIGFQSVMKNLGRTICPSHLILDENGVFRMDFADMEQKIIENHISTMIFCSPHNPSGRVWERKELEQLIALCEKHHVFIISDEIWADFITDPRCKHIPTQSVSKAAKELTMALYAPSKTFNIAGLIGAYSITYNPQITHKIKAVSDGTHYNGPNILSCYGLIGGYEDGADWVDEMNEYLRGNQEYVVNYMNEHFKGVHAYVPQATYLLWVDIADCGRPFDEVYAEMLALGILVNSGKRFYSERHIRINVACPRNTCEKVMQAMHQVFETK